MAMQGQKLRKITLESILSSQDFRIGAEEAYRGIRFDADRTHSKGDNFYEWGRSFGIWMKAVRGMALPKWRGKDGRVSERAKILIKKAFYDNVIVYSVMPAMKDRE